MPARTPSAGFAARWPGRLRLATAPILFALLALLLPALLAAATSSHSGFVVRPVSVEGWGANPNGPCPEVEGLDLRRLSIPPPPEGWSGSPVAVMVGGASVDHVLLRQGERSFCGQFGDGARMDSRFRTGVGGVFVPAAGSRAPIEVGTAGVVFSRWPPVVTHGNPSAVQHVDTLRFAFRVAVLAITFGIALSTFTAWLVARERALLLFSAVTGLMALWIALLTGLSGYPEAWLPTGQMRSRLLVFLPLLVGAGTLQLMLGPRTGSRLPGPAWGVLCGLNAALAITAGAAMLLPAGQLPALGWAGELLVVLAFGGGALASAWRMWRGSGYASGNLLALAPISLVGALGLFAPDAIAPLKTELLVAGASWVVLIASAMLMLRLGNLRRQRDALKQLAETDPLTGLANRRAALLRLESELLRRRAEGASFGLIFVDIDRFKQINDSHGHAAGDRVLVAVAGLLRQLVRASDTVARLGGEEFLLILPGADAGTCERLAERVRERVASLALAGGEGQALRCTASLGVVDGEAGETADALLHAADQAMYAAKKAGRNRVVRG